VAGGVSGGDSAVSRLSSLSPAALKAMFSPDADDSLITLLTITGSGETIRLADGYTQRISETADEVIYGVVSRGNNYTFLPLQITLPSEENEGVPRIQIVINDVTRVLLPVVRQISGALDVTVELVLSATPSTVEVSLPGFKMAGVSYNAETITAELTVESFTTEPFPAHTFTPSHFPGLF
jgi:hypothetical protein